MNPGQPLLMEFDCGNSAAKWRLLSIGGVVKKGSILYRDSFTELFQALEYVAGQVVGCRVVSVADAAVVAVLKNAWKEWSSSPIEFAAVKRECAGVRCGYDDLSQMGVDRWSAIVGASQQHSGPCIVVDAGTAITADILDSRRCHTGGFILPGFDLMLGALRDKTAIPDSRIPEVSALGAMRPGKDTPSAIVNALSSAISAFVSNILSRAESDSVVFLAGGHAEVIESLLGRETLLRPELVFEGLGLLVPMEIEP